MPLLREGRFVADVWTFADGLAKASGDNVVISLESLEQASDSVCLHAGALGVAMTTADPFEAVEPFLGRVGLVCVSFPAFTDGRGFSLARLIRQAGFAGELRARGHIIPDQLRFLLEVGYDAFDVDARFGLDQWQRAAGHITLSYQPGSPVRSPIHVAR